MEYTDQILLSNWQQHRDAKAFQEIVSRHGAMVFATCQRVLRNATDAEDVAQECFFALTEAETKNIRVLSGWLHSRATSRSLNHLRSKKRRDQREQKFAVTTPAHTDATWDDIQRFIDECIAELSVDARDIVIGHFLEGRPQTELAKTMKVSTSTVSRRLDRAIAQIREQLGRRGVAVGAAALPGLLANASACPASMIAAAGKFAISGGSHVIAKKSGGMFASVPLPVKLVFLAVIVLLVGIGGWIQTVHTNNGSAVDVAAPVLSATETITEEPAIETSPDLVEEVSKSTSSPSEAATVRNAPLDEPESSALPSISGTVRDPSGTPIANALVRFILENNEPTMTDLLNRFGYAYTDTNGRYAISKIQITGQIVVIASAADYLGSDKNITLHETDEREDVDFVLEHSVDFVGRVVDQYGLPIQNAMVIPLQTDPNIEMNLAKFSRRTGADGFFSFPLQRQSHFENDSYTSSDWKNARALLEIHAEGIGGSLHYDVPLILGDVIEFRLPQPAHIGGTVYDEAGEPLQNHSVRLTGISMETTNPDGSIGLHFSTRRTISTDYFGRYKIDDLAPGIKYTASLRDPSGNYLYIEKAYTDILNSGTSTELNIVSKSEVILTGNVIGSKTGLPVAAQIDILAFDLSTQKQMGGTFVQNGEKSYRIKFKNTGRYLVGARYGFFYNFDDRFSFPAPEERENFFKEIEVIAGANQLDIEILEPFAVSVRVVDSSSNPIESAPLSLYKMPEEYTNDYSSTSTPGRTDRDGRFTWHTMPGKELWITVMQPGYSFANTEHLTGKPGEATEEIVLVIRKPNDITGRIVFEDGSIPTKGRVYATMMAKDGFLLSSKGSDLFADGTFRIEGMLGHDELLIELEFSRKQIWNEPYHHRGPADVELDFGDIVVSSK